MTNGMRGVATLLAVIPLAMTIACSVHVDKGADGHDKHVAVDTPLGGVHVDTDEAAAANTGVPVYPGSTVEPDHDGDKAADVHLGFGPWQMRVKVVNYSTGDPQDKVLSFYRKALGGGVIECRGSRPVGTPTRTADGLTCDDAEGNEKAHTQGNDLLLKTGSRHRQKIVAFEHAPEHPGAGPTKFAVIALELPAGLDKDRQTD